MSVIERILEKLKKYPAVKPLVSEFSVRVPPQRSEGFEVGLEVRDGRFVVSFDGWHEEFESEEEALNCFGFGLSLDCRLRVVRRGGSAYKWTVQSKTETGWADDSEVGLLLVPFWRRREEVILQNDLVAH